MKKAGGEGVMKDIPGLHFDPMKTMIKSDLIAQQKCLAALKVPDSLKIIETVPKFAKQYKDASMQMEVIQNIIGRMCETAYFPFKEQFDQYNRMALVLKNLTGDWSVATVYQDRISDGEKEEIKQSDSKIVSQIYSESDVECSDENSPLIILSPINDRVLKYLAENPIAWYQLQDNDFELAIAEIYHKLGYNVERTKSTRDGGKDIIIRKPEVLGDFIYYVECKKYAPNRPVGVGIVRNLVGTVNTDRVNGGILATTSFFTRDARKFVLDNKLDYQIKMHDYNMIQQLLNCVI